MGLLCLSDYTLNFVTRKHKISNSIFNLIKIRNEITMEKSSERGWVPDPMPDNIFSCNHELRSAALSYRNLEYKQLIDSQKFWKPIKTGHIIKFPHAMIDNVESTNQTYKIPYISSPLMSGLRVVQAATGAHYKLNAILSNIELSYKDFMCLCDGSGRLTEFLLR